MFSSIIFVNQRKLKSCWERVRKVTRVYMGSCVADFVSWIISSITMETTFVERSNFAPSSFIRFDESTFNIESFNSPANSNFYFQLLREQRCMKFVLQRVYFNPLILVTIRHWTKFLFKIILVKKSFLIPLLSYQKRGTEEIRRIFFWTLFDSNFAFCFEKRRNRKQA